MNVYMNIADCCVTAREKPHLYDETGNKDDLLLQKLRPVTHLIAIATVPGFPQLV
jgi:hypothetical protein